uniref:ATP synthase CF0 subunit I n=1 Tax=Leontynka pallida TaxID=2912034 RepID=UPI0020291272|nr:ATP synthase CF0 subunit I [Leontynka pallida]UPQ43836.1 ATP synthase CF0 subunit I [Leontynka pallida]
MSFFAFAHGFGFNTNILETNIINLAAVLGIVVSFVGNNLTAILDDRKKTIIRNLEEANQRALEAQLKMSQAQTNLELAKKNAQDIRDEGVLRVTQEITSVTREHTDKLSKLEDFKSDTVLFYQTKALKRAYSYLVSRILTRVRERLNIGLKYTPGIAAQSSVHVVVNNYYVSRFMEFKKL